MTDPSIIEALEAARTAEIGIRSSLFERAMDLLDEQAAHPHSQFSPRGLARRYLMTERASGMDHDDAIGRELGEQSTRLLRHVSEAVSGDIGDVAAKLAVMLIEGDNGESGGIPEARHRLLAQALAELVIIGERPLPSTAVLDVMTEAELVMESLPASRWRAETGEGLQETHTPATEDAPDTISAIRTDLDATKTDMERIKADVDAVLERREKQPLIESDGARGREIQR